MTREEAITKLRWLKAELIKGTDLNEPIDMAIEALHQKGAYEQTKWERDMALQTLEEHGIGLGQKAEYIIPSGDVMFTSEVVRCNDCRWYEPKYKDKEYDCPQGLYAVYADDYCSHGERREP